MKLISQCRDENPLAVRFSVEHASIKASSFKQIQTFIGKKRRCLSFANIQRYRKAGRRIVNKIKGLLGRHWQEAEENLGGKNRYLDDPNSSIVLFTNFSKINVTVQFIAMTQGNH